MALSGTVFTVNLQIIQNGINGFVAETPSEMASQMNHFVQVEALYERISENAFKLYQTLTDWEGWKYTLQEILK